MPHTGTRRRRRPRAPGRRRQGRARTFGELGVCVGRQALFGQFEARAPGFPAEPVSRGLKTGSVPVVLAHDAQQPARTSAQCLGEAFRGNGPGLRVLAGDAHAQRVGIIRDLGHHRRREYFAVAGDDVALDVGPRGIRRRVEDQGLSHRSSLLIPDHRGEADFEQGGPYPSSMADCRRPAVA